MKVIEGTPEEIEQYLNKRETVARPVSLPPPSPTGFGKYVRWQNLKDSGRHFSRTKSEWVYIKDMNPSYIINILRQKLNSGKSALSLLEDDELKSLVGNLADKISE